MTNNAERGRADLQAWEASKPDNFYTADRNLRAVLQRHLGDALAAVEPNLIAFGEACAQIIDAAAKAEDQIGNHPRLQRFTSLGERIEAVEFHPNHDRTGAIIWDADLLAAQAEPGSSVYQMALFYLLTHNGEAGHACSVTCTAGLIRALQQAAAPDVREKFLPWLLDPDYATMQHGAQFLTEVQGGSDVGANAVTAVAAGDGTWRITGEKWFCSNINAGQFLVLARPAGAVDGTRGLGAFLVPRALDDGQVNGFYIRRLKDKLGTRTMASAEVDFIDALAYPVGPVDQGFKIAADFVLNTSRLMNAVGCAAFMRRSLIEAHTYACARRAFGQPIADYPLVQEAIADLISETYAATASSFYVAGLLDRLETGLADADERDVWRLLVNLNKYITSVRGTEMVHRAIEVLGGNGAIESFSILPRLYRDMVVLESWEGTHNVLCLQALRDIQRGELDGAFFRIMSAHLDGLTRPELIDAAGAVRAALDQARDRLAAIKRRDTAYQQAHARRLADRFMLVAQGTLLLTEAEWELTRGVATAKPDAAAHFINRHLRPSYDPAQEDDYLPRLARLMQQV